MQRVPHSSEAWAGWSASIDEGLALVAGIEHAPAHDLADLAVKFRAVLWSTCAPQGEVKLARRPN